MLRHDHVSDDVEVVAPAHLLEDLQKYITRTSTAQQRLALVAACGDEMQIAATVNASQASGHG